MEEKKALRKDVLSRCAELTSEDVTASSQGIAAQLFALPEYMAAKTIMYFVNFNKEVATLDMIPQTLSHDKRVVVPKTIHKERRMILSEIFDVDEDLAPGLWNIPEPKPDKMRPVAPKDIDFVVVPGVAFDEAGNRMGYGGGYYDRFFPELRDGVPLVAVTFELQMLPLIPVAPWDRQVDIIVTEKRIIRCQTGQCL